MIKILFDDFICLEHLIFVYLLHLYRWSINEVLKTEKYELQVENTVERVIPLKTTFFDDALSLKYFLFIRKSE